MKFSSVLQEMMSRHEGYLNRFFPDATAATVCGSYCFLICFLMFFDSYSWWLQMHANGSGKGLTGNKITAVQGACPRRQNRVQIVI